MTRAIQDRKRRRILQLRLEGRSYSEIARDTRYSVRHVKRVVADARDEYANRRELYAHAS